MIVMICLCIYLRISASFFPIAYVISVMKTGNWFPFDEFYEPILYWLLSFLWPLGVGIFLYELYKEYQSHQLELRQAIEIHYRDKWYE